MSTQLDKKEMSPRIRVLMASAFLFFSGFLFAFVFGWIHAKADAPLWVIASVATFFALCGILILLMESTRLAWLRNLVSWLFLVTLALPFNWIAFGEGERHFSSSLSVGAVLVSNGASGETEGRIVFGIFAVLMDLMVLLLPLHLLKRGDAKQDS
jgi:hypothetical protein